MIKLVKPPTGRKWHAYTNEKVLFGVVTACGHWYAGRNQFVEVEEVFESPVNGHTCIHCQPEILARLNEGL